MKLLINTDLTDKDCTIEKRSWRKIKFEKENEIVEELTNKVIEWRKSMPVEFRNHTITYAMKEKLHLSIFLCLLISININCQLNQLKT